MTWALFGSHLETPLGSPPGTAQELPGNHSRNGMGTTQKPREHEETPRLDNLLVTIYCANGVPGTERGITAHLCHAGGTVAVRWFRKVWDLLEVDCAMGAHLGCASLSLPICFTTL